MQERMRTIARLTVEEVGAQDQVLMNSSKMRVDKERREEEMQGTREERRTVARRPLRPGPLSSGEEK